VHLQAVVPFGKDAPRSEPAPPAPVGADAPVSGPPKSSEAPAPKHDPEADLDVVLGRKRGRTTHPMAYAFIAAAAVFGGVAAYVLLSKPQTQIVVVQQSAPVQASATASAGDPDKGQVEVGDIATGAQPGTPAPRLGLRPKSTASAAPAAGTAAPIDTSGFQNTVPGPAATAPGGSQAGGGGQLSQGEISAVVSQNQPLVKRKCWQPALEARPPNGSTTARVNGSITISASGAVDSATASGAEKDFPGLSSCIQGRMKGWKFPPSGGSTTVNVPFVFAGQ
jgi:hypothetical protein